MRPSVAGAGLGLETSGAFEVTGSDAASSLGGDGVEVSLGSGAASDATGL